MPQLIACFFVPLFVCLCVCVCVCVCVCGCYWFSFAYFIYSFIYFFIWDGVGTKDWVFYRGWGDVGGSIRKNTGDLRGVWHYNLCWPQ